MRHSMTWPRSGGQLVHREPLAGRHPDLLLHQIDSRHHLGHRMLDLDAGVHLHEVDTSRPRRAASRSCRRRRSRSPSRRARRPRPCAARSSGVSAGLGASSISFWCRRCTEQSRSPRWITLPCVSPRIWNSMCRGSREVLLHVDVAVAERRQRLGAGQPEGARELVGVPRHAHPLAAAAGRRLDDDREPDLLRELQRVIRILHRARACRERSARRRPSSPCGPRPCRP